MSIAAFIKDDLASHLLSGCELPADLTVPSLAEHYNVSYTPVRTAVAELIAEGLLEKGHNRRLRPGAAPGAAAQPKQSPRQLEPPADAYEIIVKDLVQLSFNGDSAYLREEATAEKYGVSRSVMRNILHRLAGEGMLDHIPRHGWRLRPFRQDDLQSYVEVRNSLELTALDLVRGKLDPTKLKSILAANSIPKPTEVAPRVDESLHEYIIAASGNTYIREFFKRQGRYYKLLFRWEDHDCELAIRTICQHREILTALLANKWSAARKALSDHILNNHPILSQVGRANAFAK
jgi:DNA-binding GntR family transcriptional regulator